MGYPHTPGNKIGFVSSHFNMNMDKLKTIFALVLGIEKESITPELAPENCPAWDSLNAIVLVTEIEKAFAIRFEFSEAMAVKNFGDAIALVKLKGGKLDE